MECQKFWYTIGNNVYLADPSVFRDDMAEVLLSRPQYLTQNGRPLAFSREFASDEICRRLS
jgi:hypothetical protein